MGLQDRDYWKERYDENMGIRSQPKYRKDTSNLEKLKFFSAAKRRATIWRFVRHTLHFVWLCFCVFMIIRFINKLL